MMKNASSSSATENEKHLVEEREEVMISEQGRCLKKTHFLKPFVTSINGGGSVAELPRRDERLRVPSSELQKLLSLRYSLSGFWGSDRHFVSWFAKMEALHAPTWRKAGIFEAIKASTYNITKNPSLILSISKKWCPETKSFIFPWGEATITLEDVMVLLGFSVLGSPVFAPLESSELIGSVEKLEIARLECRNRDGRVGLGSWISRFLGRDDQMEHEAFLALWLSHFVFPDKSRRSIFRKVLPVAVRLARGERIALAPTVLASLYRDLDRFHGVVRGDCVESFSLKSLFKLLQVWTWERFRNARPEAKQIPIGEPRIAQWDSLKQRYKNVVRSTFDDFDWRPYTKPLKNWDPLRFYIENAMWVTVDESIDDDFASFARCVRASQLVGDDFVEDYFPNRVARQFGFAQDLPGLITRNRKFTVKEAWDDYVKSLDGLKFYMPSCIDRGSITARYRVWWLNSVSKFMGSKEMKKEPTETYIARKTFDDRDDDDDDDIDASPKILPLSHVFQKLEQGFSGKRRRSLMHRFVNKDKTCELVNSLMKQAHEVDDESSMDKEDDAKTIYQGTRSRKKYRVAKKTEGDASKTLGKRNRRYMTVESDDSGPCQKLALVNREQSGEEDCETASKAEKTMQICDDIEVEVNGSSAEKKTLIVDEPCNKSIEQSTGRNEDGEKQSCIEKLCNEVKKHEEIDERLRQRELAIKEMELNLEARIVKMEKTLAMIRIWKTKGNQKKNDASA